MKLLNERDGLALGICNGFQALIKLGLVPYGEICGQKEDSPTLTYNTTNQTATPTRAYVPSHHPLPTKKKICYNTTTQ